MKKVLKYVAYDGTEFETEVECTEYENINLISTATHQVGDFVYYMNYSEQRIVQTPVMSIAIEDGQVKYVLGDASVLPDSVIFSSDKDLIESLLRNIDWTTTGTILPEFDHIELIYHTEPEVQSYMIKNPNV